MRRSAALFLVLTVLAAAWPARADEQLLKAGDRVMFFSSSPLWPSSFGNRVETFMRVKHPVRTFRFWHWSPPIKATIDQAKSRINAHLVAFKPTVVVLNFGLLHAQTEALKQARLAAFRADLLDLIARCQTTGARVILVTPNCPEIQQKTRLTRCKYDEVVGRYAETVRGIAAEKQLVVADWYAVTKDYIEVTPGTDALSTIDGLMPTGIGAALGAECLLEAIGAEPLNVEYQVDWASLEASATAGSISAARPDDATITIDLHGLPQPWSASGRGRAVGPARAGSPWSRISLRLNNAPPGGVLIGPPGGKPQRFSQQQVADGIDLGSLVSVARAKPVRKLLELIKRKNRSLDRYERFVERPLIAPEYAESNGKFLDAMLAEADATARIIDRTPRTMDLTLEVRLVSAPTP